MLLFVGSGTTAAVSRLVFYLGLTATATLASSRETFNPARHDNPSYSQTQLRASGSAQPTGEPPKAVVFVGSCSTL